MCLDLAYQEMMRSSDPKFAIRYQISARIVPEGRIRLPFSADDDSTYNLLFPDRLLGHCRDDLDRFLDQA